MNWKTWLPLVLAIVLGLAAMKVARDVMSKNDTVVAAKSTQVVVLTKDIPAGVQITPEDLSSLAMAGDLNVQAVFTNPGDVQGRVLAINGIKGAPVLQTMLAPKGAGPGLQSLIPDGMRAITIEINEFSGVAGNLTTGSHVDIVSTLNGEGGEMISRTIVQNVKVQSLGMRQPPDANNQGGATRSVTLLVTPREAEVVELAVATGRPRLVLRGVTDGENNDSNGVTIAELRHGSTVGNDPFTVQQATLIKPTPAPAAPTTQQTVTPTPAPLVRSRFRERQIKVIRGGVESITTVQEVASPINNRWMTGAGIDEQPVNENN